MRIKELTHEEKAVLLTALLLRATELRKLVKEGSKYSMVIANSTSLFREELAVVAGLINAVTGYELE